MATPTRTIQAKKNAMEFAYSFIFQCKYYSRNISQKPSKFFFKDTLYVRALSVSFVSVKCLIHTKL